ncbi:hypothetical protein QWZ10_07185 [Paracoccus cavernae]|uniref:ABC transporter ATP-binding protein n=1 Tax=Paracoccus cavernae TaxID=1571207 RepID=A0ABT8D8B9_9RHOB|nr:hypothetical protein [Paracoccus cavernae]
MFDQPRDDQPRDDEARDTASRHQSALTIRDLHKSFEINGQKLDVLRGLNLEIRPGRPWPLSGPPARARPPFCAFSRGSRRPIAALS